MLINGVKAKSYKQSGSSLEIVLQCGIDDALKIDDSILKVTTDAGSTTEVFSGYTRVSTSLDSMSGYVSVRYEIVDGTLAESLASVASSIGESEKVAGEAKSVADEAKATADTAAASMNEYMDALLGLNETEATDAE